MAFLICLPGQIITFKPWYGIILIMSGLVEKWKQRVFGSGTPEHHATVEVVNGQIRINVELKQPKGTMVVRYKPGTEISFADEEGGYRPFGEEEVIFAKEIHFFGQGMSNGQTTKDVYFKAMDDPLEVTPLENITPKRKPKKFLGEGTTISLPS